MAGRSGGERMNLIKLKQKYHIEKALYEPRNDCPRCHGSGEYISGLGTEHFCFCIFIDPEIDIELLQATNDAFNKMASDFKKELHDEH
jgi:hypothetical protein